MKPPLFLLLATPAPLFLPGFCYPSNHLMDVTSVGFDATQELASTEALVAVILLSASPVGEILVAIPAGVALGLEPFTVFLVALVANLIPIAILIPLLDRLERRFPRLFNYFAREGERFRKKLEGRYGSAIMLLITPFIGVYAASVSSKILRFGKLRSFFLQFVSLASYGLVETIGLYFGIQLLPTV